MLYFSKNSRVGKTSFQWWDNWWSQKRQKLQVKFGLREKMISNEMMRIATVRRFQSCEFQALTLRLRNWLKKGFRAKPMGYLAALTRLKLIGSSAFLETAVVTNQQWPEPTDLTERLDRASIVSFFEAKKFTAAILMRPLCYETSVYNIKHRWLE